jgi:hypothetical protein
MGKRVSAGDGYRMVATNERCWNLALRNGGKRVTGQESETGVKEAI